MKVMGQVMRGIARTGKDYTSVDVVVSVNEIDEIMYPDGMTTTQPGESLIPLHLGTTLCESVLGQGIQQGDRVQVELRIKARQSQKGNVYPELYARSITKL